MAARAKKSRGKSGRKTGAKRGASKRRGSSAARKSGRATKRGPAVKRRRSTKSAAKKKRPAVKKRSASAKRSQSRSAAAAPKRVRKSPIARVKRVALEVAEQATSAVAEGVDAIKDIGETLVDRVTG